MRRNIPHSHAEPVGDATKKLRARLEAQWIAGQTEKGKRAAGIPPEQPEPKMPRP
jgi:hypothetical protein